MDDAENCRTLYISNLSHRVNDELIYELFLQVRSGTCFLYISSIFFILMEKILLGGTDRKLFDC